MPDAFENTSATSEFETTALVVPADDFHLTLTAHLPFPVVGIGAAAGGLEPLTQVFRSLPVDSGMAFVVVTHLPPTPHGRLSEILARVTAMPVSEIEEGMVPHPDEVFVVPAGSMTKLIEGRFHLESRPRRDYLPIDHLFQSMAADQKNRAIAVVLSGADSDGALGVRAIKGEGGIAIVQEPASARFPTMPQSSIFADHVDLVLSPAEIGTELGLLAGRLTGQVPPEEADSEANDSSGFSRIYSLLQRVAGVDFRQYKDDPFRRRVARRMVLKKLESLEEYVDLLVSDAEEIHALHEDLLINVTRFFRDPETFEVIKERVLAQLLRGRNAESTIRAWVAGCSSGEEVYSLAIGFLECLSNVPAEPAIQIFGTDLSERAIARARAGIYPESIAAHVSPERLRRFFVRVEKGYQLNKRVRGMCIFARQNICMDPPFSRLEMISCRNVLIYLRPEVQQSIIPTFNYALKPGGYLVLGNSETLRDLSDWFTALDRKHKIYVKRDFSTPRILDLASRAALHDMKTGANVNHLREAAGGLELQRAADRVVLARYGPAGVIVNEQLEILQTRGHTSNYLEMSPGVPTFNLLHMVREDLAGIVRDAVSKAIDQDVPVRVEHLSVPSGDSVQPIYVDVLPVHNLHGRNRHFLVLFVPIIDEGRLRETPGLDTAAGAEAGDTDSRMTQLRHDLVFTKNYLQSLLEERDARNQELISANDEIKSANEELQSINEELETAKEALQSANEEVQTVNEELQSRNAELTHTTNDLANLLNNVDLPVLMLSSDLRIRRFTSQCESLLHVRPTDVGRPISEIRLNLELDDLEPMLREVLETLSTLELEVQDRTGRWHLLRARAYRTDANRIEGLVLVFVDINQLVRSQVVMQEARDFAQLVVENVQVPLAVLSADLHIRNTNGAFRALTHHTPEELDGASFADVAARHWSMDTAGERLYHLLDETGDIAAIEFTHESTNGIVLRVNARKFRRGTEKLLLVAVEDVTSRVKAERLLRMEKERLEAEVDMTQQVLGRTEDELRALAGKLFFAQEEERRRVARELHDDFAQRLAVLEMDISQLLSITANPDELKKQAAVIREQFTALNEDIRTVAHNLHPVILEDLGLAHALRGMVAEFGRKEAMPAQFTESGVIPDVNNEIALCLYRIGQEALRNVVKHAGKTHVKVSLTAVDGGLRLLIRDFGEGVDLEKIPPGAGLGLLSMEERARLVGGRLEIKSAPGEGTAVEVFVPLVSREQYENTRSVGGRPPVGG